MASRSVKAAKEVYRGYIPIDLPQHRKPNRIKPWWKVLGRPRLTIYPKQEPEEYSEEPEYPPLNDASIEGLRSQVRYNWYEKLKSIPTADEKLFEINRHCEHRLAHIHNWLPVCNSLPIIQYLTQTLFVDSLPESYKRKNQGERDLNESKNAITETDDTGNSIKKLIFEQIELEKFQSFQSVTRRFVSRSILDGNKSPHISNNLIANIINQVKRRLALNENPQLNDYHVDLSPDIRSWWYHSGFPAPDNRPFYKSRKDKDGLINQIIQMDGSTALNFRSDSLIQPIVPMDDPLVTDITAIEKLPLLLRNIQARYVFKWPVALPGFWFKDTRYDCPHTCFLSTDCLDLRNRKVFNYAKPLDDDENCLHGQAILTAFGWLNSMAMYHGFTPFQELSYPLTCQVITTNGQNWLFNVYQLNSHTFHRDFGGPKRNNICWSSGYLKLFESYENGNFKGINDDVVHLLMRFLSQQTNKNYTNQLNLRPYMNEDCRTDEERENTRKSLRDTFEGRTNRYLSRQWSVPIYEHVFFRSKASRYRLRHMKPRFHPPKPKIPLIFE